MAILLLSFLLIACNHPLSRQVLGEHKLCEGGALVQAQPVGYQLTYDPQSGLIKLSGELQIGVYPEFQKLLDRYPAATGVVLESEGGNVYQGRGLAKAILAAQLDTYTFGKCYSACAIAYMGGMNRHIGPNGRLGFHAYRMGSQLSSPGLNIAAEQAKDSAWFQQRIPDSGFVDRIFDIECAGIWRPTVNELLQAGVVHAVLE